MALTQEQERRLAELEAKEASLVSAPLAPAQSSAFTPEMQARLDELEAKEAALVPPEGRAGETFIQSFGDVVSLGYLPQLQAGASQLIDKIMPESEADKKLREMGIEVPPERSFVEERDIQRQRISQLQEQNPLASAIGTGAGAIVSGIATGGVGTAAKGAGALAKVGSAAAGGGALAFLQNPGDVEGELTPFQFKERLSNMATGALTAGVLTGGFSGLQKGAELIRKAPGRLKNLAEMKALKAGGFMTRELEKAVGNKKANRIGRKLLNNNLIQIGDDIDDVAKNIEVVKESTGQELGNLLTSLDDQASKLSGLTGKAAQKMAKSELDMTTWANAKKVEIIKKWRNRAGGQKIIRALHKELDAIARNGKVGLSKARELRSDIDDLINFSKANKEIKGVQGELLGLRTDIKKLMQQRIRDIDSLNPGQNQLKEFNTKNELFSDLSDAFKAAEKKSVKETANRTLGLSEQIGGGTGAVVGASVAGVPGALVGGALGAVTARTARKYGPPAAAKLADKVARALEKNPSQFGKFSEDLLKASEKGVPAFVRAVTFMNNDPEFKKATNERRKNQ